MKRSTKKKLGVSIAVGVALLGLLAWGYDAIVRQEPHLPLAAMALQHVSEETPAQPVTDDILQLNPKRKVAGLAEVTPRWLIAPSRFFVMDGPTIRVLLDERGRPAKVILGPQRGYPAAPCTQEYEVSDGRLNGKSAVWLGDSLLLNRIETYRDNQLEGLARYDSEEGDVIASCVFHEGRPWNGRMLGRNRFKITSDVSYRNGELDGKEILYKDGRVERLRTFKDGVQHGLERRYYDSGVLMSETIWVEGVVRSNRGWHRNGRIASESTRDARGRMHGLYRMWNEDGTLWFERPHRHGKQHGRYREQGHSDHWFWNGQSLGGGDYGKKRFMALLAEEE